jgi:hypothetical protein
LHQRALAGAILAEECVDFPRAHREIDMIVRKHAGKALYDVPRFQGMLHRLLLREPALKCCDGNAKFAEARLKLRNLLRHQRIDIDFARCDIAPGLLENLPFVG